MRRSFCVLPYVNGFAPLGGDGFDSAFATPVEAGDVLSRVDQIGAIRGPVPDRQDGSAAVVSLRGRLTGPLSSSGDSARQCPLNRSAHCNPKTNGMRSGATATRPKIRGGTTRQGV
jgi:hypothetical protein